MSVLLNGDCLEEMKGLDDDSVDLIFCDLPYVDSKGKGQTSCAWNQTAIDLDKFWIEIMRIKKLHTPIFFTTTTKFGVELITSAPKKCYFRYDLVWLKKSSKGGYCSAGFLNMKRMPGRAHEMVYVFYEKLPLYDLSSHKHKFIKEGKKSEELDEKYKNKGGLYSKVSRNGLMKAETHYDPALPVSVVEPEPEPEQDIFLRGKDKKSIKDVYNYDERVNSGKLYHHPRKLQKGDEPLYEPALPVSVVPEYKHTLYGDIKEKGIPHQTTYDPALPNSLLHIKSTRGKHPTEKPVALCEFLLKYYSRVGDVVLDPTMGSGSMGVACKNMNRNFIGIEMDHEIYEGACERLWD